jgi:nitrate/nitrite transport system ATP-binding protein
MIDSILEQDKINRDPQGFEKYMLELSNLTKIYPTPNGDFVVLENLFKD